jgi:predicted metal-dependent enzyme (double-stranded beta helix superfamily)
MINNIGKDWPKALFTETRQIIAEHGLSPEGMKAIQNVLCRVAADPGWRNHAAFAELERTGATLTIIESLGDNDLTLVAARFVPDHATPIHDHTTWGVACVVKGRDRYIHWERLDDGSNPDAAHLQVRYDRVLETGEGVYWFDPPGDIHSQQGAGETARELVLFGRNPLIAVRHSFDPDTGRVSELKPK